MRFSSPLFADRGPWEIAPASNWECLDTQLRPGQRQGLLEVATFRGLGTGALLGEMGTLATLAGRRHKEWLWWEMSGSHGSSGWAREEVPKEAMMRGLMAQIGEGIDKTAIVISVHRMFLSRVFICRELQLFTMKKSITLS